MAMTTRTPPAPAAPQRMRLGLAALALLAGCAAPTRTPSPLAPPAAPRAAPVVAPVVAAAPAPAQAPSPASAATPSSAAPAAPAASAASAATTEATTEASTGNLPRAWATESPGVAARFPDPTARYATPAFAPQHLGYTSNAELRSWLQGLVRDAEDAPNAPGVKLLQAGSSQTGVPIPALLFTHEPRGGDISARPTVLLIAQQHGDEPAGAEALLAVAQALAQGSLRPLLERINVIVLPRANPDGAVADQRLTASAIDVNRDHLLLRTPEAQAQAQLVREHQPVVVVDLHEYTVVGRYLDKFNAVQRFDALFQYATVANLPGFVTKASEEWFRQPLLQSLQAAGLSAEWYYTTSTDVADKKVSMGGVQPDTGRNVNGLRNAISLLIETRGVGLGRVHLARRVHTHVVAVTSVLNSAAARALDLARLRRFIDADVAAQACKGQLVVEAAATPSEYALLMLDPVSGADKTVSVAWDSSLQLARQRQRARPCGYWLGADQLDAVLRLRGLGVRVMRLDAAGTLRAEAYLETARETAREAGTRADVRGTIADAQGSALRVKVALQPLLIEVNAGSFYVPLDQPLANLVVAALEPDTQNSYLANRIIASVDAQARVLGRPDVRMTLLP